MTEPAFKPGENCWQACRAARSAIIVDGEAYFRALHEALGCARHQVMILAWDVDSRTELLRGKAASGVRATGLEERLHEVLDNQHDLHVYLLDWDFSVVYLLEREWMPVFRLPWARHRRLAFELDGQLPAGASHHQKIVVIDDAVAFAGGLDITRARWDTSEHKARHPQRRLPDGGRYGPFHDLQALVAGEPARALGKLARQRWLRATGQSLPEPPDRDWEDCWPASVKEGFDDLPVAIARTSAQYGEFPEHREVEKGYLEQIAAARDYLYFENQYLTSADIVDALCRRLSAEQGPEIVIVVPRKASGWLEETTMGEGRDRSAASLREADRHGRLRILCPMTGGRDDRFINVHGKLLIADDRWMRVGSANLSNRSMRLDTECDLVFDGGGETQAARWLLARLLGEHTGAGTEAARAALDREDGLIAAVEALTKPGRRLEPLPEGEVEPMLDPAVEIADPEEPLEPAAFSAMLAGADEPEPSGRSGLWIILGALALLIALGIAWKTTPLGEWLSPETLGRWREALASAPWARPAAVLVFPLASFAVAPVTLLIAVAGVIFGPYEGFAISIVGVGLAAAANYAVGAGLGRRFVRRVAGSRVNRVSRRLARQGILAMAALRLVPVAPFTVVNLVAGASHISFRDYLLGTLLGMAPGIAALSWFTGNAGSLVAGPGLREVTVFLVGLGLLIAAVVGLRAWLKSRAR
ncbi:MAG: VTT domain-containing protein [Gammaproteobacteria bacterium]